MDGRFHQADDHHGLGAFDLRRHALVLALPLLWLAAGVWLHHDAIWPLTCDPVGLVEIYACSPRLPESGRWTEGALLTWLWSTPILLALELGRLLTKRPRDDVP